MTNTSTTQPDCMEVEPYVVLMAVRYGLGRKTYAHVDALRLVRRHWPQLKRWRDSIVNDLEMTCQPWMRMHDDQVRDTRNLLDWINEETT